MEVLNYKLGAGWFESGPLTTQGEFNALVLKLCYVSLQKDERKFSALSWFM